MPFYDHHDFYDCILFFATFFLHHSKFVILVGVGMESIRVCVFGLIFQFIFINILAFGMSCGSGFWLYIWIWLRCLFW